MPLDVLGRTRATLTEPASSSLAGRSGKRKSSACVDYVPALCTHRPSLLPIEWFSEASGLAQGGRQRPPRAGKLSKLDHLEENSVNHRIFERTLRPLVFRRACLFERHFNPQALLGVGAPPVGIPAELKHINKRRKRNQQGLP
ncbi:hypothetical protein F5883DRAFT_442709 [Diaporthe sp. PMI_573]|nr:hypothetical protein F5883DRAFT_442709 [Diaporthaceae sp. PMI_573]